MAPTRSSKRHSRAFRLESETGRGTAATKALDRVLLDTDSGLLSETRPDVNGVESHPGSARGFAPTSRGPAFAVMLFLGWIGWRVGRRLDRWLSPRRVRLMMTGSGNGKETQIAQSWLDLDDSLPRFTLL